VESAAHKDPRTQKKNNHEGPIENLGRCWHPKRERKKSCCSLKKGSRRSLENGGGGGVRGGNGYLCEGWDTLTAGDVSRERRWLEATLDARVSF